VLVAVGRKAPTADIGLQNLGLNPGGFLELDEHMRVRGVSWLCDRRYQRPGAVHTQGHVTRRGSPSTTSSATGPQSQIAAAAGCSQMHVSRILAASLEALRTQAVATPWRLDTSGRATRSIRR
jgi:hypothetical protein